jgi:hypothetical protein
LNKIRIPPEVPIVPKVVLRMRDLFVVIHLQTPKSNDFISRLTFAITGRRQPLHPTKHTESFRCIAVVMLLYHSNNKRGSFRLSIPG